MNWRRDKAKEFIPRSTKSASWDELEKRQNKRIKPKKHKKCKFG